VVATEGGDKVACRQLVESFLPAIGGIARRFDTAGVERGVITLKLAKRELGDAGGPATELVDEALVNAMRATAGRAPDRGRPARRSG
jgi:hypothetical protein